MDVEGLADLSWPVLRRLMGCHARIYRATAGLIGHRFPGALPMLLLDSVGAKSGTRRTTPLVYVEDGRDVVIVASKGGHPKHPAWYQPERAPRHNGAGRPRASSGPRARRQPQRARPAVAEGCRDLRRLPRLPGAHGPRDPLVNLEPRA